MMFSMRRSSRRAFSFSAGAGLLFTLAWMAQDRAAQAQEGQLTLMAQTNTVASNSAQLEIRSPSEGAVLPAGQPVSLEMAIEGFELGKLTEGSGSNMLAYSKNGQHIHVIVDNKPYMAIYDVSSPVDLGDLGPGVHTVEAFASRSWHESVKSPGARKLVTFYVGSKSGTAPVDPGKPLLTYSRPKGTYEGADAQMIMVDFYLTNATLSPTDYKARVTIDGKSTVVDSWNPYHVHGLEKGMHTVKIELIDPDGNVVPGAYNSTEREIEVK